MLVKTALLIVTNPKQISQILPVIQKRVENTLYIHLLSVLNEPFGCFHPNIFKSWPKYSQIIFGIYSQAALHCQNLDVRVLLSGLKYKDLLKLPTKRPIDLVIFDKSHPVPEIDGFLKNRIGNTAKKCDTLILDSGNFCNIDFSQGETDKIHKHTVLGGTFDHLHIAHKLLINEAALRADSTVTIGVTNENMLKTKLLWELIEDLHVRIENVRDFLSDICPELTCNIVAISDPYGPAITDPTMDLIVVSEETVIGGTKINEIRKSKDLNELDVVPIKLIDEPCPSPIEEKKISSSTIRIRLLGTLLKIPVLNKSIPKKPYVIGLTGGIASGKSGVAKWLNELGALVVNCDLIGHQVYEPGKVCHQKIVETFGNQVLDSKGKIDRKVLGTIVFKNPNDLETLNKIVWPEIGKQVQSIIQSTENSVVVVEAAVLLSANWQEYCHEIWVTIVPKEEQIKRLIQRNCLTEKEALARINVQFTNRDYVNVANVVFCPYWDEIYTRKQVDKAWQLLKQRL